MANAREESHPGAILLNRFKNHPALSQKDLLTLCHFLKTGVTVGAGYLPHRVLNSLLLYFLPFCRPYFQI